MTRQNRIRASLLTLTLTTAFLLVSSVLAQPGPKPDTAKPGKAKGRTGEKANHERPARRAAGQKAREAGKAAREKARSARAEAKVALKAAKAARKKAKAERKANGTREAGKKREEGRRLARKKARIQIWQTIKSRLGEKSQVPIAMQAELRLHARRIAILKRIEAVAESKNDQKAKDRVASLVAKENQRHQKRMDKLTEARGEVEKKSEETKPEKAQKTEEKVEDKAEKTEEKKGDQK